MLSVIFSYYSLTGGISAKNNEGRKPELERNKQRGIRVRSQNQARELTLSQTTLL